FRSACDTRVLQCGHVLRVGIGNGDDPEVGELRQVATRSEVACALVRGHDSVCEGKGDIRIAARDERHVVHRGVRRFHRSGVAFHELVDDLRVTAANRVVDTTRAACCDGQRGLGGTETYDYGR